MAAGEGLVAAGNESSGFQSLMEHSPLCCLRKLPQEVL